MPDVAPPLPPIPPVTKIDEVVDAIQSIVDWSISASSRLGYFAALYKRITIAVRTALEQGAFENTERMERFDVAFASRYFDALNGYFHPETHSLVAGDVRRVAPLGADHRATHAWGVNAHIDLDLGIVAHTISPSGQLTSLHADFNTINAVLASQINDVVARLNELSPALADLYAVLEENEIFLINEAVRTYRDSAWRLAIILALEPAFARPLTIWARDRKVAEQGELIYDPPGAGNRFPRKS